MSSTFSSCVQSKEGDSGSESSNDAPRVFSNIWPGFATDDVAGIIFLALQYVGVLRLSWINTYSAAVVDHGLWCICCICRDRWWKVVLEKQIVFISCTPYSAKDIAQHEIVDIAAKSIDNLELSVYGFEAQARHTSWSSQRFS